LLGAVAHRRPWERLHLEQEVFVRLARRLIVTAVGSVLLAAAGVADAEEHGKKGEHEAKEGRLPVSYTERPLTLPRLILNPELELALDRIDLGNAGVGTFFGLGISARFGILDDLEAYALVLPLELGPFGAADVPGQSKAHYANPKLGATYRFLRGRFELGATLGLTIVHQAYDEPTAAPVPADTNGVILEPGAVFKLHIIKEASLEGGLYLPIELGGGACPLPAVPPAPCGVDTIGAGLRIPLAFAYDIVEPFHIGVRTGVGLSSFAAPLNGTVGENLYIPLGIFAGYAVAGKNGPIVDIDPFFTWPALFTPSAESHGLVAANKVHPGDFSVGVSVGGFFYF
jgi:hypothetical protein